MSLDLNHFLSAARVGAPIRIFYHHPCLDGFAAAYAAWLRFGDRAQYIPYGHADVPCTEHLKGSYVIMCDCCYPRSKLLAARAMATSLIVLDHHKSSMDQCADLDLCHFDMQRSGSGMAWDFFHPGHPRPLLIECVQDGDLGLYALPSTRDFCAKLETIPFDFASWHAAAALQGSALAEFITQGSYMLTAFKAQVQAMTQTAQACMFLRRRTYLLNAPYRFASHCGEVLCARSGCEMAIIWSSADLQQVKLSLRSPPGSDCDCSLIALSLGGGGHAFAAGATLSISQLISLAVFDSWDTQ